MMQSCDLCDRRVASRTFRRRNYLDRVFCSIACVEAFEVRTGLPNGRVYESRPGWSSFPAAQGRFAALPC